MLGFNRKKEKEDKVTDEIVDEKVDGDDKKVTDGPIHAMGDGDVVPQGLKEKLAEIRGQVEPDFKMVEVDEDGKPIKTDGNEEVKDGEVSSGDADESKGDFEEEKSELEGVEDTSEYEQVELDPRLEAAGEKLGWSKDKIIKVAETDLSILKDLANQFEDDETHRQENKDGEEKKAKEKADLVDEKTLATLKEKLGDDAGGILDVLIKQVEDKVGKKFEDKFKSVDDFKISTEKKAAEEEARQRGSIANDVFDRHAEVFKEFGLTKDLPKSQSGAYIDNSPQMKVRNQVYEVAAMFYQFQSGTFEDAMNQALMHYAGTQGVTTATRKIVKDLKDNQKRFSPKPTGRKFMKVFRDTDAKKADIVQTAKKTAGIE